MSEHRYQPAQVEPKWQQYWQEHKTFRALDPGEAGFDSKKPKYYVLDMFPYPSGAGLHVGHPEGYTATDILARYRRARGFNVLHPMGWDAFGLPAEQYAIQTGTHPSITTQKNITTFKRQIESLGFSYDWSRELATTDGKYVRWTQWIFEILFDTWYDDEQQRGRPIGELPIPEGLSEQERRQYIDSKRLAFVEKIPVWWCTELGTVLANEEVIDGRSERGSYACVRLPLKQWMLRITSYAGRLLRDLDLVEWPDETKKQQAEWIGESHGAEVWFPLQSITPAQGEAVADGERVRLREGQVEFKIFTTCPDTLFGVTFMVLAPEHALVDIITTEQQRAAVKGYRTQAASKSDLDRTTHKDKSGVWTGAYAINPVNGDKVPIWIADYVLATYGTGAIMAVPGHDQRDHEFAKTFGLDIIEVIAPPPGQARSQDPNICFTGPGISINSPWINGQESTQAKQTMGEELLKRGLGQPKTTYRLRDWIFSRQRYWGEPFPVLHHKDGSVELVPADQLPLELPLMEDFRPSGSPEGPLGKATDWIEVQLPDGRTARRETNTMPNWAGSCWYYLRFLDPDNLKEGWSREKEAYWMPVDLYVGGREHAVLHLLYARFWHKVLFDRGLVTHPEPFGKLFHQGMIVSFAYEDDNKATIAVDMAQEKDGGFVHKEDGRPLRQIVAKMSKTLKNVVNPDEIVREHGADTLRIYEMFMGPLEDSKPWNSRDVGGITRFLQRIWRLIINEDTGKVRGFLPRGTDKVEKALHRCIKKVTDDLERMAFNTAVSAMMIFLNEATAAEGISHSQAERFVQILAPFAPHMSEELWQRLGHPKTLAYEPWPSYDPAQLLEETVEVPVQINGKVRAKIVVARDADAAEHEKLAREAVAGLLEGKSIRKVVVVPLRMVSVVVG